MSDAKQESQQLMELKAEPGSELAKAQARQLAFLTDQREAAMYAKSNMVPKEYRGNIADATIAVRLAHRVGADPLTTMQNLHVINGRPSWSAQFLIAVFNATGRFDPISFEFFGEEGSDAWGCEAVSADKRTGKELRSTRITIKMAKAEGWLSKSGSKWKTMPSQMMRYRAAAFLIRTVAPEISHGLLSAEEAEDIAPPTRPAMTSVQPSVDLLTEPVEPQQSEAVKDWERTIKTTYDRETVIGLMADVDADPGLSDADKNYLGPILTAQLEGLSATVEAQ